MLYITTGQYLSASDIDFYIDTDAAGREMVIVSDTVHQKQHTDFLARHISECCVLFVMHTARMVQLAGMKMEQGECNAVGYDHEEEMFLS